MTVILAARDLEKGKAAAEALTKESLAVLPRQLDVSPFAPTKGSDELSPEP